MFFECGKAALEGVEQRLRGGRIMAAGLELRDQRALTRDGDAPFSHVALRSGTTTFCHH
ncbi:MAG: hypothetical protein JO328_16735 [Hyphomicrobiales bacterium]|nr:hypothetical protein [Hyphomicrobiales bacterium]MBV8824903.1 hypothetical protein [Hyphomicrobiales bacterium]MBV9428344.1 hypothetical protein [Bradyrhizobiaceae bacterium]